MSKPDRAHAIDHVVSVMFENRSFDNLLGRLYQPGEVPSFEGVLGKDLSNPIPEWAEHGAERGVVPYGIATDMDTPNPDPGEEYPHINTQLFGTIDPAANRCAPAEQMVDPFNAPADPPPGADDGRLRHRLHRRLHRRDGPPTDLRRVRPDHDRVHPRADARHLDRGRGFATFDHWFCEVPSQTFTNRSFFHAASASGFVTNMIPTPAFPLHNTAETIFERLEAHGLTWRVYCDHGAIVPFTGMIHAARLADRFDNFVTTERFLEDVANGDLPTYSFIEPNMLHGHNDMHPACNALFQGMAVDSPSSLLGGEALLAKVYDAVRASSSRRGSNAFNTLLMVNFDEHGGCFDHVPPPPAPPPDPSAPPGEMGFAFDRSGVRIPTIAISPWIPERTVVTEEYRNTSVLRTLRERWVLGRRSRAAMPSPATSRRCSRSTSRETRRAGPTCTLCPFRRSTWRRYRSTSRWARCPRDCSSGSSRSAGRWVRWSPTSGRTTTSRAARPSTS